MLEKTVETHLLFDNYAPLLTERQRRVLEMRLFEDWSLTEIALELSVSKQAVHDLVHRTVSQLMDYEEKLGLLQAHRRRRDTVSRALSRLRDECAVAEDILDLIRSLADD